MELIKKLPIEKNKNGNFISYGIFLCPFCLQEVEKRLNNGKRDKSCGCNKINSIKKHGWKNTKLYISWVSMKQRILNPNDKAYKDYGGRGITICNEWLEFIPFKDWSLSNNYQEGLEIDRRDTNGNYEPSNCRWVTSTENNRNKRDTKLNLEKANEIRYLHSTGNYTQQELAEKYNINQSNISAIINNKYWRVL